ncbi:MAG: DUF2017 domain-containing protein [Actinomycetota bacterium]|nr:DUF2017 domain-containing protein [Actinomycetota bacterium]
MTPFRWRRGRLVAQFEPHEAALLRQVVSEIRDVLSDAGSNGEPASERQADAVAQRLLPDGHRSDPALAEDYRSLTESGLRQEKLADAALLLDSVTDDGGRVELGQSEAEAWTRTLNDVRLAIGVRLDVQESDDPMLRAEQTGDPRWAVYSWLTAVQGLLIDALIGKH